jgi:calcineurin-like phosphoesterase family protein
VESVIEKGSRVLLLDKRGKRYLVKVEEKEFHTDLGILRLGDLIGKSYGARIKSHRGETFVVLKPDINDIVAKMKRGPQIVHPKDAGIIIAYAGISPGDTVIHLGDLVFKGNPKHYIKKLNGAIYLVPGNHDKTGILTKYGVKILDNRTILHRLLGFPPFTTVNGIKFSHYPGAGRVFAHVHTNNLKEYPFHGPHGVNVSAEVVNYRTVPLDKVLDLLK